METALEAISLDPYRERAQKYLMQAYVATGNKAEAINVYHRFGKLLAQDLGSDPSPETEALYLKLLD